MYQLRSSLRISDELSAFHTTYVAPSAANSDCHSECVNQPTTAAEQRAASSVSYLRRVGEREDVDEVADEVDAEAHEPALVEVVLLHTEDVRHG